LCALAATACWLASLRHGDDVDRVSIIEHYGRPGYDWYVDFLRGRARIVVKDYDFAMVYLSAPGWSVAVVLVVVAVALRMLSRHLQSSSRGFDTLLVPPRLSASAGS
jgi:hypothetical protein